MCFAQNEEQYVVVFLVLFFYECYFIYQCFYLIVNNVFGNSLKPPNDATVSLVSLALLVLKLRNSTLYDVTEGTVTSLKVQ